MPYRDADRLGSVVREHRFTAGPLTVGVAVFFIAIGIYLSRWGWHSLIGAMAITSFVLAALFLGNYWLGAGTRIVVHERGLVHVDKRGTRSLAWDEIESIRSIYEIRNGVLSQWHRIVPRGGDAKAAIRVGSDLSDVTALVEEIFARTDRLLLDRARETIAAGERARFGPLSADREGLRRGEELSPWGQAQITLADGIATIAGLSGHVPVREIDNVRVLTALLADPPM